MCLLFLIFYVLVGLIGRSQVEEALPQGGLVLDCFFILAAILLFGRTFSLRIRFRKKLGLILVTFFIAGALTFTIAKLKGLFIPFSVTEISSLFMLFIGAPLIEEFLFRYAIWDSIEKLSKNKTTAWVGSSLIFSYGHFHAFFFIPETFHSFLYFQTAYTFLLAFAIGFFYRNGKNISVAILSHAAFNLAFGLCLLANSI